MAEARRRRLSPARRRFLLQVLGVIAVIGVLVWGADTLARIGAQSLLARNIQDATGVEVLPEVDAHGIFFLPQVIRGAYSDVHVTTLGITSGPLRINRVESRLSDVRVPFHDVLVRDIRRVGLGRSVENFDLTYEDLNAYFAATGRRLKLAPGPNGTVRLTGVVEIANQSVPVSADASLSVARRCAADLTGEPQYAVWVASGSEPFIAGKAAQIDRPARHTALRSSPDRRTGRLRRLTPHRGGDRHHSETLNRRP